MKKILYLVLSLLVIALDQASKYWVLSTLKPYETKAILPMFNLTLAYNPGVSFGFLVNAASAAGWYRWFFISFTVFICIFLTIWILRLPKKATLQGISLSLILGGALGNLYDRLVWGHVIDFIDLYYKHFHWYVFNVADAAICVGAFLLIVVFAREPSLRA